MESWILPILAGLSIGMVTFVVASGLSLTFGVMRIINFGHGAFFELALYFTIIVAGFFSNVNVSFWVALLLVPIIVAMIGGVTEVTLLHRTYFKDPLYQVLVTYGIAMIISEVVKIVWSSVVLAVPGPSLPIDTISIMGQKFPAYHLLVMVISGLIGLGLWFMLEKTSLGVLVRAVINDRETASAIGVRVSRVATGMFMLGIWLAALGGVLMSPMIGITPGIGTSILLNCFVVVIIGGMGSLRGSFIGALALGLVLSLGNIVAPLYYIIMPFALMVIVLIVKPRGLFGIPED